MAIFRDQAREIKQLLHTEFSTDILHGLTGEPKSLPSKYFYDETGDKIFRQIMRCPEYYLTRCEMEIFSTQTQSVAEEVLQRLNQFDIVELGAGDAVKSTHLLRYLRSIAKFTYYPVDISSHVIQLLEQEMPERVPGIAITGLNGEYFDMIRRSYTFSERPKLVLFLGSNIGNFQSHDAKRFLDALHQHLLPGDLMMIGFDLRKNPKLILSAYNDAAGITKAFNMNLLTRINRELGADFDLENFDHYPSYDPASGECRSFLVSLCDQHVCIDGETIFFARDEVISTELSKKYSVAETDSLAFDSGFCPVAKFYDKNHWFLDAIWERS